MPQYQSHKKVWALKILSVVDLGTDTTTDENPLVEVFFEAPFAPRKFNLRGKPTPEAGWYYIQYADGYESFSPAEAFEEGYKQTGMLKIDEFDIGPKGIGWAIKQMWNGELLERDGWNGKGLFIFIVPGSKFVVNRPPLNVIFPEGTEIEYCPHIDIKSVDGKIVPWLASQTDILATDYRIVKR